MMRRTVVIVGLAAAIACPAAVTMCGAEERAPRVTCAVPGDRESRVFRLQREGAQWVLAFQARQTRGQWLRLDLPRAEPIVTSTEARLSYRNANGGRQVDVQVTPSGSSLDVWVDYGLEVNIAPDLDPRVDLMNTEGPLDGVQCVIAQDPDASVGN
jgi:hypothetical protein